MKLPKGVSDYETPFNKAFAEAIVRDCATTAKNGHRLQKDYTPDAVRDAGCIESEQAILARYGLEPK